MKREIIINTNSLIKSGLHIHEYFILQIIYDKDIDFFNIYIKDQPYYSQSALEILTTLDYLKYTGKSLKNALDESDTLDILDFVLLEKATKLFVNDKVTETIHEVDSWIGEYRNLFKGIKIGSMGDPNACLKKMKIFLKANSKYTKEQIFEATKAYIKNTEPKYTMQADYFISKVDANKVSTSRLFIWLEQIELVGEITDKSSLNKMI